MSVISPSSNEAGTQVSYGYCSVRVSGQPQLGILLGDQVALLRDVTVDSGFAVPVTVMELLGLIAETSAQVDAAILDGTFEKAAWDSGTIEFLPPVSSPQNIFCAGANYADHIAEMGLTVSALGKRPFHFLKSAGTLLGHRQIVQRPPGCQRLDWEVELAVVIGCEAWQVQAENAANCICGYMVANDLSARDFALENPQLGIDWLRQKTFRGSLPIGPALVPSTQVPDPMNLRMSLTLNGSVMQQSSTSVMIFDIATQISALSHLIPLKRGDIILTGTPAGTGRTHNRYLTSGDVLIAEIGGIGRLITEIS